MEYLICGPGDTAQDAEKISAGSTTAAIREWCEARQRRDPQFASFIDGREVTVSGLWDTSRFVVSVIVADPIFESKEVGK